MECYFDDLIVVHKYPNYLFESILRKRFTIKETSDLEYFLGGDFEHIKEPKSNNEILMWVQNTYAKRMMDNLKNSFDFDPSKQNSVMSPNYNSDIDITDLLNDAKKAQHCKCVGEIQWALALGRIDIIYAIVVLSWYRPAPTQG